MACSTYADSRTRTPSGESGIASCESGNVECAGRMADGGRRRVKEVGHGRRLGQDESARAVVRGGEEDAAQLREVGLRSGENVDRDEGWRPAVVSVDIAPEALQGMTARSALCWSDSGQEGRTSTFGTKSLTLASSAQVMCSCMLSCRAT